MHVMRTTAASALLVVVSACGGAAPGPGGPGTGDPGNGGPGPGDPSTVTSVTVTPATGTVAVGATLTLGATVEPAGASQAVTWTTSSTAVATVDANGVVTGAGPATVTITATSQADPSRSGSATLEVVCVTYAADALPSRISSDITVPPGCHDLNGIKRITDGATLRFEGPAVVRATSDTAGIRVEDGTLRSLGEEATPIRFTAQSATPGSWHGFRIESGTSGSVLRHTTIEYAGRYANAFHLRGGGSLFTGVRVEPNASVTLDSVTIRRTGTGTGSGSEYAAGLFLERTANVTMTGDNRFVQNDGPGVHVTAPQIAMLATDADYGGGDGNANGVNVVLVNDDTTAGPPAVISSATWADLGVPYRLARTVTIEGSGTLVSVSPGARFEAASGAAISVQDGAGFSAVGGSEAADRIVFTGVDASSPGAWIGFHVNTPNAANELRNASIEYAGQGTVGFANLGFESAVRVGDGVNVGVGGGQAATLTFVDNVVRQSAGSGIRLEHPDTLITPDVDDLAAENTFESATIADDDIDDVR